MKKGISLMVLVITIIIIIILAGVTILSFSRNNPIESAKKAVILQDLDTFRSELSLSIANARVNRTIKSKSEVNQKSTGIYAWIPSMEGKKVNGQNYCDILVISNGVLMENAEATINEVTHQIITEALDGNSATVTPNKTSRTIRFAKNTIGIKNGASAVTTAVTNSGNGVVTYSSSSEAVATVNSTTGAVTPVAAGTTTITATVTDSDTDAYPVKTATYDVVVYTEETGLTVAQAKAIIDSSNIQEYMGIKVQYAASADTGSNVGTYRVFFLDTTGKYDEAGTLFIKRDYLNLDANKYATTTSALTISSEGVADFLQFNTQYPQDTTSLTQVNDTHAAYLCTKSNWTSYKNNNAAYAIGTPSLEMFVDSYNQWKNGDITIKSIDCKYMRKNEAYGHNDAVASANGYAVAPAYQAENGVEEFFAYAENNSVRAGATGRTMYTYGTNNSYWIASPSAGNASNLNFIDGNNARVGNRGGSSSNIVVCPVISLGN